MDALNGEDIVKRWGLHHFVVMTGLMAEIWLVWVETKYVLLVEDILEEVRASDATEEEKEKKLTCLLWYMQYQFFMDSGEFIRKDTSEHYSIALKSLEESKDRFVN